MSLPVPFLRMVALWHPLQVKVLKFGAWIPQVRFALSFSSSSSSTLSYGNLCSAALAPPTPTAPPPQSAQPQVSRKCSSMYKVKCVGLCWQSQSQPEVPVPQEAVQEVCQWIERLAVNQSQSQPVTVKQQAAGEKEGGLGFCAAELCIPLNNTWCFVGHTWWIIQLNFRGRNT